MCGIVGYVGPRQAHSLLIKGLKHLEYRGYDSAGIAVLNEHFTVVKKKGKVINLEEHARISPIAGNCGIGHTRWATHGVPSDVNAHPHVSQDGKIALVHNGIIENSHILKKELISKGYKFNSETDTEVLVYLIADLKKSLACDLTKAVQVALEHVTGAFALAILCEDEKDTMVLARRGSPLVVGLAEGEFFVASDASPIVEYTKKFIYPKDNELVVIKGKNYRLLDNENNTIEPYIQELDLDLAMIEKGSYEHYMHKEIMEQAQTFFDCLRGRLKPEEQTIKLGGILNYLEEIKNARRIIFIACGTSWHAGLLGKYLFEDLCAIPTDIEYASEFRYRNAVINEHTVVIGLSQSGETADTLVALEKARKQGAKILGICNVAGSTLSRITHAGVYTHVGKEIGVASTKAFTGQLAIIYMLGLLLARERERITHELYAQLIQEISELPPLITKTLEGAETIADQLATQLVDAQTMLYLGRGLNYAIAMEGALKMTEISYIHAQALPSAEMKHGPIALIDNKVYSVVLVPKDELYEKNLSNIQEIKARGGRIVAIATEGDQGIAQYADYCVYVPKVHNLLTPILAVLPLQLIAYKTAKIRGHDIDQPRNLAKSVTVE